MNKIFVVYTYAQTHRYTYIPSYTHPREQKHRHADIHICAHTHTRTHACTPHTHTHACTPHTYTHIQYYSQKQDIWRKKFPMIAL